MTGSGRIRVMVIDDSAYSRQAITRMLSTSPLVEVVGVARDGEEALRKIFELEPDLVTLDLEMPRMDGFTFLRLLMGNRPTPVLVISSRSSETDVWKALDLGAVDFVSKPTPRATLELATIEQELIRKVHGVRELRIEKVRCRLEAPPEVLCPAVVPEDPRVVVMGASTGGPAALMQIFTAFSDPPPCTFLVAQHMPAGFTESFAERVHRLTPLRASEARGGECLEPGQVLVAPGGRHLELEFGSGQLRTQLAPTTREDKYAPSVDRLFESAAKHVGADLLAVVLTGMGDDGMRGARAICDVGGRVIAESEETAVIFGMPQKAIRAGAVHEVLRLSMIPSAIRKSLLDGAGHRPVTAATQAGAKSAHSR